MYLFGKYIDFLTEDDVKRLVETGVAENKTLEYKSELSFINKKARDSKEEKEIAEAKREFLADVAAMANTDGGIILFGIEEMRDTKGHPTGIPKNIVGISIGNQDKQERDLEIIISSNTNPQLNAVKFRTIEVDGLIVLLLGIRKFIGLPHMITSSSRFYRRRGNSKYPINDTNELYQLFMNNSLIKERANNFVKGRISEVRNNEAPISNLHLYGGFFLHIIPLESIGEILIDFSKRETYSFLREHLKPIDSHTTGLNSHNLDGYLCNDNSFSPVSNYVQIFRDGALEYYTNKFIREERPTSNHYAIFGREIEDAVFQKIKEALTVIYDKFQIESPFAIFIQIFDTKTKHISTNATKYYSDRSPVAQKSIQLPSIILYSYSNDKDLWLTLKPIFDIFWQAGGYSQSPSYERI